MTISSVVFLSITCTQKRHMILLKMDYLGQKIPGLKPEVFAPGLVSTKDHKEFGGTFSPDGKEFYFNRDGDIMVCRLEKSGWTAPEPASFNSEHMDHEPHITADGSKLFFGSNREEYGIWMTERSDKKWGEPFPVGSGMYVTTSRKGNIYLTSFEGKDGALVRTGLVNGKFTAHEGLKGGVDSPFDDWHPCIAPDESYILFDSNRPGSHQGEGAYDLYVCFRNEDGTWGDAVNIGKKLNIQAENICASISPDGKYLFYNSINGDSWDIYWVDAKVIHDIKPDE